MRRGIVLVGAGDDDRGEPTERRIMRLLAQFDLGGVERLAVLRDQRPHHRMLGLVGLQVAVAGAGVAAGAADHLMQKLERALGGARIAIAQAEIGIDHADQIEHREVMALGDQLGADDDVELAGGDIGEFLAHALDRGDQIARQHQHARVGKQRAHLLFEALDARPDGDEGILRLAVRAGWRMRHGEAAMMADQLLAEAVIDQPGVAVRAGEAKAAGAAQRQRRIAAAIEKQQRLLARAPARSSSRRRASAR